VDDVTVVDLSGRITLGEGSTVLRDTVRELLGRGQKKILLNLGDVTYIDSSGLAVLIEGMQNVAAYGGRFAITGLQESVRPIFEIARLDQVFRIYPDVDAAFAAA